jgi:hypothetical protein
MKPIKLKRGRKPKPTKDKVKRVLKSKCPMCEDLNKSRKLNKDKMTVTIDLKPVIFNFELP